MIFNRSSRRKRGMASNPLFIICTRFSFYFPNELCYGYLRFEGIFPISFKPKVTIAEFFWKMQRKTWYIFHFGVDAMPLSLKHLLLKLIISHWLGVSFFPWKYHLFFPMMENISKDAIIKMGLSVMWFSLLWFYLRWLLSCRGGRSRRHLRGRKPTSIRRIISTHLAWRIEWKKCKQ